MNNRIYTALPVQYDDDLEKFIEKGLSDLDLLSKFNKGKRVLIKVNAAGPFPVTQGATTHPAVVRALARIIKKHKAIPSIGDGMNNNKDSFAYCGLREMADSENIPIIEFNDYIDVDVDGMLFKKLTYSREVLDADVVVSAAKLKTHCLTHITGAIKNMFGAIKPSKRKELHVHEALMDFSHALIDIYMVRRPDFSLMDGIISMVGPGPIHGKKQNLNVLFIAEDSGVLDVAASRYIGYNVDELPFFIALKQRLGDEITSEPVKLGNTDYSNKNDLQLVPVIADDKRKRFLQMVFGKPTLNTEKCTGCRICGLVCPVKAVTYRRLEPAINGKRRIPEFDMSKCIFCHCCYELCPEGALIPRQT